MDKYGGTWLDASLLLLEKIPAFIMKQDFFILQSADKREISNFFIHSCKNNLLTKTMRIFLEEYWKYEDTAIDYFFFHHYFMYICMRNDKLKNIYQNIIPYPNHMVRYMTDNCRFNADKDCWDYLSQNCFMYKISRKQPAALQNKNSWYWFLLNKYKNNKLIKEDAEKSKK